MALYALMIAMPLVGWAASSAGGREIIWFGLFEWPLLPIGGGREMARSLMDLHELAAKAGGHAQACYSLQPGALVHASALSAVQQRLHRQVQRSFDPHGVFDTGRLWSLDSV